MTIIYQSMIESDGMAGRYRRTHRSSRWCGSWGWHVPIPVVPVSDGISPIRHQN